jgi:hypothetical protein
MARPAKPDTLIGLRKPRCDWEWRSAVTGAGYNQLRTNKMPILNVTIDLSVEQAGKAKELAAPVRHSV